MLKPPVCRYVDMQICRYVDMQVRGDVQHGGGVLAWLQHHVLAAGAAGGALGAQSGGAEMAARVTVCQIRLSTFANVYIDVFRKAKTMALL